jgi:hypothetical protein
MATSVGDRQRYALDHPCRTIRDVRQGHSARTKHRFQSVLTVDLSNDGSMWRAQVAFLSINWQPLPFVRWPARARETALILGRTLLDGVGAGEMRKREAKNTLLVFERDLQPHEMERALIADIRANG